MPTRWPLVRVFSVQCQGKKPWAQTGIQEGLSEHQAVLLCCVVMKRWHRLPASLEISSSCPERGLGTLLWKWGWVRWTHRALPASALLGFHNSCEEIFIYLHSETTIGFNVELLTSAHPISKLVPLQVGSIFSAWRKISALAAESLTVALSPFCLSINRHFPSY